MKPPTDPSNYPNDSKQYTVKTLASAIRGHWSVESNNWQLHVTFGEDRVQVGNGIKRKSWAVMVFCHEFDTLVKDWNERFFQQL